MYYYSLPAFVIPVVVFFGIVIILATGGIIYLKHLKKAVNKEEKETKLAEELYIALGRKNIQNISVVNRRMSVNLLNISLIDLEKLKELGFIGTLKGRDLLFLLKSENLQIADELLKMLKGDQ